jgi:hypothetical protein
VKLDLLARASAEALRRSVERATPDGRLLARARRRRLVPGVATALLLTVALVAASLWVRSRDPDRPDQVVAPAPAGGERPGTWRRLSNGPQGLHVDQMVWTPTGVLVFAGATHDQSKVDGARYDPGRDRWHPIRRGPLDWRSDAAVAWTGDRLVVWGGARDMPVEQAGAAYHPASDTWTPIAPAPMKPGAVRAAVWTGRELLVWREGGQGAAYDPRRDAWRRLSAAFPQPRADRDRPAAVWTGREVLIWSGCPDSYPRCDDGDKGELDDGAAYDPAGDRWRPIAPSPLAPRSGQQAVWTGSELLVWGGDVHQTAKGVYAAAYDPAADRWRTVPTGPLAPRSNHTMVWTGRKLLVWGGVASGTGTGYLADGAAFDPATGTWRSLPGAPVRGRAHHVAAWTGQELLIWGGRAGAGPRADGAAFRPG